MRLLCLCLLLATTSASAADFEGIITGKPITPDGGKAGIESMKMYLSAAGFRVEVAGAMGQQFAMLCLASTAGTVYILDPASKTYLKRDTSKAQQAATTQPAPKVEKLGKTTFLGRAVERVKVTNSSGQSSEVWVDTSLHYPASAVTACGHERGSGSGLWRALQALEKAGVGGIPLKEVNSWEATSVEKQKLAATLFQVPADYHETKNAMDMVPAGVKQQLQNLTPEQRAKLEEAMKGAQQPPPPSQPQQ